MSEVESQRAWYEMLEGLRYLLPEEDAKDKFAGESWGSRLQRTAEKQLEVLAGDEQRYRDEMTTEQDAFRDTIGDLQVVRGRAGGRGAAGRGHLQLIGKGGQGAWLRLACMHCVRMAEAPPAP